MHYPLYGNTIIRKLNASTSTTQNSSGIITNLLNTITGFIHHIRDSTDPISNTVSDLTGSGSTLQEKITALGGYIQATKGYNSSMTIFGKAMTEHLDNAKQGKTSTHMSLPNYDNLESSLQRAKEKGSSGFK